jgi:hypothetical protein
VVVFVDCSGGWQRSVGDRAVGGNGSDLASKIKTQRGCHEASTQAVVVAVSTVTFPVTPRQPALPASSASTRQHAGTPVETGPASGPKQPFSQSDRARLEGRKRHLSSQSSRTTTYLGR